MDVNVQVQIGDVVVGNVIEHRVVGANGVAKGGVVLTTTGTALLPDSDVKTSEDPRIGRLPPPPPSGPTLVARVTPGPTMIVTPPPSFVSRVAFDPRLTLATATPTPAPTTSVVFNGAYQPYATKVEASATPAPNSSLTVFSSSTELTTLRLVSTPTPTPAPTLSLQLTSPFVALTPAPAFNVLVATPSPAPTVPAVHPRDAAATRVCDRGAASDADRAAVHPRDAAAGPLPDSGANAGTDGPPLILATRAAVHLSDAGADTGADGSADHLPDAAAHHRDATAAPTTPRSLQTLPPIFIATPRRRDRSADHLPRCPGSSSPHRRRRRPLRRHFQTLPTIFFANRRPTPTPLRFRTVAKLHPG